MLKEISIKSEGNLPEEFETTSKPLTGVNNGKITSVKCCHPVVQPVIPYLCAKQVKYTNNSSK